VENLTERRIKILRSDNGGEYTSMSLEDLTYPYPQDITFLYMMSLFLDDFFILYSNEVLKIYIVHG